MAETRTIGSIPWGEDEDHSPAVQFRVDVQSDAGYPIFVFGRLNVLAGTLSFALVHRGTGRIYALDLGADHHNPSCNHLGEKHKHRWSVRFGDKEAYVPEDIQAGADDPVAAWAEFCAEARIQHRGTLERPPAQQLEFGL